MALNGVMAVICVISVNAPHSKANNTSNWLQLDSHYLPQKCTPMNLVFNNIYFIAIFAEATENECINERHCAMTEHVRDTM